MNAPKLYIKPAITIINVANNEILAGSITPESNSAKVSPFSAESSEDVEFD